MVLENTCHADDAWSGALSWKNGSTLLVQKPENIFDERILYLGCAISTQEAGAAWRGCVSLILSGWRWCRKDLQCRGLGLQPCPGTLGRRENKRGRNKTAANVTWKVLFLRRRCFPILPARHVTPLCWERVRMAALAASGEVKRPERVPRARSIAACPSWAVGPTPSPRALTAF